MKVAVVYCYPLLQHTTYFPAAKRFADTWKRFEPGEDFELHLMCNGAEPRNIDVEPFRSLNPVAHAYSNQGWDIGAFQWAADHIPADLMVFLGAKVHFHRAGWLARMVESYVDNGPNLYGCAAYLAPNWHVRTTAFWCHPMLLRSYPFIIGSSQPARYAFEHGNTSFTRHVLGMGLECIMVTWNGCFPFNQWRDHAPGADNILVHDQHIHS